jgi:hypothetical protein
MEKNDLLQNFEFASNQIARYFVNRYYKGRDWYWYRDFTSGEIMLEEEGEILRGHTLEEMLCYLKHNATKGQLEAYEEYLVDNADPLAFRVYKDKNKKAF